MVKTTATGMERMKRPAAPGNGAILPGQTRERGYVYVLPEGLRGAGDIEMNPGRIFGEFLDEHRAGDGADHDLHERRPRQRLLAVHVLAGPHRRDRLLRVQLGRGAQDHGVHVIPGEGFGKLGARVFGAVLGGNLGGLFGTAADDRGDLHPGDVLQAIKVLFAKGAGTGQSDTHRQFSGRLPSRLRQEGRRLGFTRPPAGCGRNGPRAG